MFYQSLFLSDSVALELTIYVYNLTWSSDLRKELSDEFQSHARLFCKDVCITSSQYTFNIMFLFVRH